MTRTSRRGRGLRPVRSRGKIGNIILAVIGVLLIAGLVLFGSWIAQFVAAARETLDQIVDTPVPALTPGVTPQPTAAILEEPFTVLLMGIDRREDGGATLNDVNIVVYVDPGHHFASMLSIPRDTRVYIPEFGYNKINAAYGNGEEYLPDAGGGPTLCKRTIEQFLDIPIDYYAVVDFRGFERIIDLVGGITVDVPTPLVDNEYPTEDYGYTRIYFPAGLQHMNGCEALRYARSRHADTDIARNQRQQQVLMALRERILRLEMLTDLDRLKAMLDQLGSSFRTDIQLNQLDTLWALVQLVQQIERDKITTYALDWQVLCQDPDSSDLFVCNQFQLEEIIGEMQMNPTLRKLREEAARVEVRNGTFTCNLCAARTYEYLHQSGFYVVDYLQDNDAGNYTHTLILGSDAYPFTCGQLAEMLHVEAGFVCRAPSDSDQADVVVILGDDYKVPDD